MAIDVTIGSDTQPTTGLDVWISTNISATLIDFVVPYAPLRSVLMIAIVRNAAINCSDTTWTRVVDGVGSGGQFVDVFAREVDGTTGGNEGDVISFLALAPQEMLGGIVVLYNAVVSDLVYDIQHQAYTSDTTPDARSIEVPRADDTVMTIWCSTTAVDLEGPADMTELDDYGSSSFTARSIVISTMRANDIGTITPGAATSTPASTGRTWTLGIRFEQVLFGHASRAHPIGVTNPSRHARRTT